MPRHRILQVTNGFPPTASAGVELHTYALAKHLQSTHDVHVFCREANRSRPDYQVWEEQYDALPVTRVVNNLLDVTEYEHLYRNLRIDHIFTQIMERFQPDVVHIQHCIGLSIGCLEIALDWGIPVVATLHDYWYICPTVNLLRPDMAKCRGTHHGANCFDCIRLVPRQLEAISQFPIYHLLVHRVVPPSIRQKALSFLATFRARQESHDSPAILKRVKTMRRLLERASVVLTPSQHVKNKYIEFGLSADLIQVLPLGMDVERWLNTATRPRYAKEPLRFGYAGSFLPTKGVDVMVRAFKKVPGHMELYLCGFEPPGHSYPAQLRDMAADDPRIHYVGPVANEQLPKHFAQWDAFVMPTLCEETFSFAVREALLSGLPVLASNLPVMPEIVRDNVNGYLLPPGDVDAWAACLARLIADPEQLARLKPGTDISFVRTYRENAQEHIALYQHLLSR